MTSATEELRRLLDERGVEYDTAATVISGTVATFWHDRDGYPCSAIEGADDIPSGEVSVQACITPEQAVAATLGPGTCHAVFEVDAMSEDERIGEFVCSECGETFGDGRDQLPRYCPECGRRCVG